jgi:hypothetical protein
MTHNSRQKHGYANCDETARTQIQLDMKSCASDEWPWLYDKGNEKITELRTILQRESQNS